MSRDRRTPEEAQALAERARDVMWAEDRASRLLGMEIVAIGPGSATLVMTVRQDMTNSHAICHGGFIATLADSAFAFACNAYNEMTVASGFDINLIAAATLGDRLTATCTELHRAGRTGVYDVSVVNQRGDRIAAFRGRSYALKGRTVIPE